MKDWIEVKIQIKESKDVKCFSIKDGLATLLDWKVFLKLFLKSYTFGLPSSGYTFGLKSGQYDHAFR